ncbi:MAG: tRNA nucleotidyltransferase, partial [Candidatus Marinimicrobia bacterium]|nr:tRNA nucleotidyltransferase [Candidatus Neomarinimicrobiota bacterium]
MLNIKHLLKLPEHKEVFSILRDAGKLGEKEGLEVYAVGGLVRDLIMGESLNDIDIMVVGNGIQFAKKLSKEIKINKVVEFEKFGTAIIPNGKFQIEVASARVELYNKESRKPKKVINTDLEGDLIRSAP